MLKGPKQPKPSGVELTPRAGRADRPQRASRGGAGGRRGEFVHAFADALRDILQDERSRAA